MQVKTHDAYSRYIFAMIATKVIYYKLQTRLVLTKRFTNLTHIGLYWLPAGFYSVCRFKSQSYLAPELAALQTMEMPLDGDDTKDS